MRRVVTGVDSDGQSHVVSCDEVGSSSTVVLWDQPPRDAELEGWIEEIATDKLVDFGLDPGGARFLFRRTAPRSEPVWHTANATSFITIVRGALTLMLDRQVIEVRAGDVVVDRATHHAWRNEGDVEALMVGVVLVPTDPRRPAGPA